MARDGTRGVGRGQISWGLVHFVGGPDVGDTWDPLVGGLSYPE